MSQAPQPATRASGGSAGPDFIAIRGASEHNLRDLDLRIPRDELVVITGLSGSGKSSLAFDTLYAEGQRRYVESLSAYARQFLEQMSKPEVESIDGLSPAISIEQKSASRNPRSTVGTVTEIADYLRLLFARVGRPRCHGCGLPIASQTVQQIGDRVLTLEPGRKVQILAPVVRGRKGSYRKELDAFRRKGFVRARIDGTLVDLGEPIELARQRRHDIDVVVDRLVVREQIRGRLSESIETALDLASGLVKVDILAGGGSAAEAPAEEWLFSQSNACVDCGISYPEITPRMFSFNSPSGACPDCDGLGVRYAFDGGCIVPDPRQPLLTAIEPWNRPGDRRYYRAVLTSLATHLGVSLETPWRELPEQVQSAVLQGLGGELVEFRFREDGGSERVELPWHGVVDDLERRLQAAGGAVRWLERYRSPLPCEGCGGARLRVEARHVELDGKNIAELCRLSCGELAEFLDGLSLPGVEGEVAERIVREIRERLGFLSDVGLDYLSLERRAASLSGGEGQRIRLATQIGASLMGVLYILDEPSVGLHPRDNRRLIASLSRLRDMGNSVIVVEHDEATIRAADHIIDMGPGAGIHGGDVVAQGELADLLSHRESLTGAYLSGRRAIPVPAARRPLGAHSLTLMGCREHNLKNVTLRLPLGVLTVVTGVSGSGKSSLIVDTLHRALAAKLHAATVRPGRFERLEGVEHLDKVIEVDQAAIGRSPRSNPATYSGAFSGIRKLFSQVPEARARGYGGGRFSFNVKGGRCESCQGNGLLRVEMNFLPDLFVRCEVCNGRRYTRETLEIRYKGRSIAEVLDMTVEEALDFMHNTPPIRRPLEALREVGLGYIHLGQPATTLSGGEAQRIKLARELARRDTGRTLYLLDEPTTGLHFADVEKLLELLARLVDRGNTVVIIEHHLDVIKTADHVVDLGPEGAGDGGEIVAQGTPEELARHRSSHTGRALAEILTP